MDILKRFVNIFVLFLIIFLLGCHELPDKSFQEEPILKSPTKPAKVNPILGPQSQQALGEQRVLVVAVRFPDVQPRFSLQRTRRRAVDDLDEYVREQSYGLTWIKADFRGWVMLPDPISMYKVSQYNFFVDRSRVRKLIEDTMTAIEKKVDFLKYHHMLIIPGVFTRPGIGYGMIAYCANPGALSGVGRNLRYVKLTSKNGKTFQGGIFVGAETAHLGMFAHDFFHAMGGIHRRKRLAP